jgi:Na+-translocating ferredoxin:NAD+ oxidoreductase RnfD subunit
VKLESEEYRYRFMAGVPSDLVAAPLELQPPRAAGRRAVTLRGRVYPVLLPSLRDARLHVAAVILTLQVLGQTVLGFRLSIAQILLCLLAGALIEFVVAFFKDHVVMWPASGLLTGNSTAFILRVPGTAHGDWWSLRGWWIFLGVVVISMASKYVIRWRGRHIFNPSNLGLVLAFVALGPKYTEPQDLWWIPIGPWMLLTYAVLIGGGLWIGYELKLIGLEAAYLVAFALAAAFALAPVPDHCMTASWHSTPMCGQDLWQILVTSPEVLVFALFMVPDPKTVPDGRVARILFGATVGVLSVLLLGPTTAEFWTKTAILASLVVLCGGRFGLARWLEPLDTQPSPRRRTVASRLVPLVAVALVAATLLPVSAAAATRGADPRAQLVTSPPGVPVAANEPTLGAALFQVAGSALPGAQVQTPASASAAVFVVPAVPAVVISANVAAWAPGITHAEANREAGWVARDLAIAAVARRTHDKRLAAEAADGDALDQIRGQIDADAASGRFVMATYTFDRAELDLFLPAYATQASRLVGVTLIGTVTIATVDAAGTPISTTSQPYRKSWGLDIPGTQLIANDYTNLQLAP